MKTWLEFKKEWGQRYGYYPGYKVKAKADYGEYVNNYNKPLDPCLSVGQKLTVEDVKKAVSTLKANDVPGPYWCVTTTQREKDLYSSITGTSPAPQVVKADLVVRDDCPQPADKYCLPTSKKKEENMYLNTNAALDTQQKAYLLGRLNSLMFNIENELAKTFGIYDSPPRTAEDLVNRIKEGKYEILDRRNQDYDDYDDRDDLPYASKFFRWTKKDQAGYDAALERANKAKIAAQDAIWIKGAATGLKILQEFEATDFAKN